MPDAKPIDFGTIKITNCASHDSSHDPIVKGGCDHDAAEIKDSGLVVGVILFVILPMLLGVLVAGARAGWWKS